MINLKMPKKCHKKNKPDKEPVLPTRRSGRIRIKEERQREEEEQEQEQEPEQEPDQDQDSGPEESESESEAVSPTNSAQFNTKRRLEETDLDADSLSSEPRRKRGRPPKSMGQSFELIELKGDSEEDMIADTLLKVEQNMGDSLVKLDGSLFKVELSSQEDIKDFNLNEATEIKMEEAAGDSLHDSIKQEFKFADQNIPDSIHCHSNPRDNKVTVSEFYVEGSEYSVSTKFVREEVFRSSSADVASTMTPVDAAPNSAYAVVVNVLKDIVSSISD